MKRWTTVIGRCGTTLIAISLALLLVSFVPSIHTQTSSGSGGSLPGGMDIVSSAYNFNPQQEIVGEFTVDGTITLYLLDMYPELTFSPTTGFTQNFTSADLEELMEEHPEKIIFEHEIENDYYKWRYSPTRVMNITLVTYNQPDSENAHYTYDVAIQSGLAPKDKVRTIAYWVAPIGVVLAIPWLINLWKQRKNKTE
jgi:hypothetical protein